MTTTTTRITLYHHSSNDQVSIEHIFIHLHLAPILIHQLLTAKSPLMPSFRSSPTHSTSFASISIENTPLTCYRILTTSQFVWKLRHFHRSKAASPLRPTTRSAQQHASISASKLYVQSISRLFVQRERYLLSFSRADCVTERYHLKNGFCTPHRLCQASNTPYASTS